MVTGEKKDKHMTFRTNQQERDVIKEVCRRTGKNKAELIIEFFENLYNQGGKLKK